MESLHVKSFVKETSILTNLSHFNLISYYFKIISIGSKNNGCSSCKIKNNHIYLRMELIEINLRDILKIKRVVSHTYLIHIIYQIIRKMCHLHDMYIAHHSLKLDNILVSIVEKSDK